MIDEFRNKAPLIKMIGEMIEKKANSIFMQYDITFTQARVLVYLFYHEDEGCAMKSLEHIFGVSQQTMSGIISRLEYKGLTKTIKVAEDRRLKNVVITDNGRLLVNDIQDKMLETDLWLFECFTPEEKQQFLNLLKKIYRHIKEGDWENED